jgi:hypothetical protein
LKKIEEGTETDIIYSLTVLENADYQEMRNLLEQMLQSPSIEVRKYAIDRLGVRNEIDKQIFNNRMQLETDPIAKEKIVTVLCKHDHDFLYQMSENLDQQEDSIRKAVIIGLLNQQEFAYLYKAGTCNQFFNSFQFNN